MCRRGRAGSCYLSALQVAATQPQRSEDLLLRSCRQGVGPACAALASNKLEDGVSPGYARLSVGPEPLIQLLGRGCTGSYGPACFMAAKVAQGVAQTEEARQFFQKGCRLDEAESCATLARERIEAGDRLAGLDLLARACRNWSARACSDLAAMIDQGLGAPTDHYTAFRLFGKACMSGDGAACARYAEYGLKRRVAWFDAGEAVIALQRGCDLKYEDSCKGLKTVKTALQR